MKYIKFTVPREAICAKYLVDSVHTTHPLASYDTTIILHSTSLSQRDKETQSSKLQCENKL
jgi:hypothetical protein